MIKLKIISKPYYCRAIRNGEWSMFPRSATSTKRNDGFLCCKFLTEQDDKTPYVLIFSQNKCIPMRKDVAIRHFKIYSDKPAEVLHVKKVIESLEKNYDIKIEYV